MALQFLDKRNISFRGIASCPDVKIVNIPWDE